MKKAVVNRIAYVEWAVLAFLVAIPFLSTVSGEAAYGAAIASLAFLEIGAVVCFVISLVIVILTKGENRLHIITVVLSAGLALFPLIAFANARGSADRETRPITAHQTPTAYKAIAWVRKSGGRVSSDSTSVELSTRSRIRTISPLSDLPELKRLAIPDTLVSDLSPLADLANLEDLDISSTDATDLRPLAGLTRLKRLKVVHTQVSDLSPLAQLTNLEGLSIYGTNVSDLGPIAGMTSLKDLQMSNTNVSDLSPLANLTNLEALDISDTKVTDLTPLAGLTGLERLALHRTEVSDLTPLVKLPNLGSLEMEHTKVTDLSILARMANLRSVGLNKSKGNQAEAARLKEALPTCAIRWIPPGNAPRRSSPQK